MRLQYVPPRARRREASARVRATRGVTLLELIAVLIMLSAIAVVALGRLDSTGGFAARAFAQDVRAALRFAQKFAVASGCQVQVNIVDASDSYDLQLRADALGAAVNCLGASGVFAGNPLRNPQTGAAFAATAPAGVDVGGSLSVVFDAGGRSAAGGAVNIGGDAVSVVAPLGLIR